MKKSKKDTEDSLGKYLREINKIPVIDNTEEQSELLKRTRQGDKTASRKLIEGNLRLVFSAVKTYKIPALPLEDLVGFGNIGLVKAANYLSNPSNGNRRKGKFSTYAFWSIKNVIREELRKLKRQADVINPLSLDQPIDPDDSDSETLLDRQKSESPDQEEEFRKKHLRTTIEQVIDTLPPREAKVIKLIFGFNGNGEEPLTLREVGERLGGLSRQAVEYHKERALDILRRPSRRRILQSCFDLLKNNEI